MRHPGEVFAARAENEWPLKRTQWTKLYLDPAGCTLDGKKPAKKAQPQPQAKSASRKAARK